MSIDYGQRERQFLDTLEADSGRSLEAWMAAIAAEKLAHRNDIIDWLRRQGFMFSKASWLERIYNNGGRPIYEGAQPRAARPPRARSPVPARPAPAPASPPAIPPAGPAAPAPQAEPAPAASAAADIDAAIAAELARAKAYRPLAVYLVAEIRKQAAAVTVAPGHGMLMFQSNGRAFAALAVSPKDVRLGLALAGAPPAGTPLAPGRLGMRGAPPVSHVATLTDARQITPALLAAVAQAAAGG